MKISVELARHFAEVLSSEEMNVDFKLEDKDTATWVHNIVAHKRCPICGNLENVHFIESIQFDDAMHVHWARTAHECNKCHKSFMIAVRITKEEEND